MLKAGGARVTLAGFRRGANALAAVDGIDPIELGTTRDGRFGQRVAAVARARLSLPAKLSAVDRPDVIIARNLDMLAVANRAVGMFGGDVPVVYECLDIHRLLLRHDVVGRAMRASEAYLGRNTRLLITSSPAFVEHYFRRLSGLETPIMLLENKVLEFGDREIAQVAASKTPRSGGPWKIGWFGALRCRKSLELLSSFSRRMEGRFEIVLRGRPAYSEFDDFDGFIRNEPHMTFHGPYRSPEDLSEIYDAVDFTWAIDFFEEGQNSKWLLPNRLYEGCRYGRVPIAIRGTETARFLAVRGIGLLLDEAEPDNLVSLLGDVDESLYADASHRVAACNSDTWVFGRNDCENLVRRLSAITPTAPEPATPLSHARQNEGGLS